jgi:two-component system sporulation sensor kinase A
MAQEEKLNYKDLVEKMPEGVFVVDRKGLVRFVNRAGSVIFARPKGELMERPFGLTVVKGKARDVEIPQPSGVPGLARMEALDIEWGGEKASLVFLVDISDRRKAEEAMIRSEESFRLAFEEAKDAIFWADVKTGMLINCNKSAERLMEADAEDIIGRHQSTLHPPDMAGRSTALFQKTVSDAHSPSQDAVVLTRSGRRISVSVSTSVMKIGGRDVVQGIFRDMTEHNRAEESVRLSEERYSLLAHNIKDLVWTSDMHLNLTYVSPSSIGMLGYTPQECISSGVKSVLTDEAYAQAMEAMASGLRDEKERSGEPKPPIVLDLQHVKKDGSIIWCEMKAGFLRDPSGMPVGIIGVTRDITERKKSEAKIKNAYERLKETQEGLIQSEKLAAIGKFSSGIAHEVKNPLGVIVSAAEFLEVKIPKSDADAVEALDKIKESALRAAFILHSFLEYARPSRRLAERIDANRLVKEAADSLMIRPLLSNIEADMRLNRGQIMVEVDKNQMIQVIFNIIKNALEAMPAGGKITVTTSKEAVRDLAAAGKAAVIEIKDSGRGISPESMDKIFEPFYTTKEAGKGTGLGLYVSKTIVENHGGALTIESVEGKGTRVRIALPLAE